MRGDGVDRRSRLISGDGVARRFRGERRGVDDLGCTDPGFRLRLALLAKAKAACSRAVNSGTLNVGPAIAGINSGYLIVIRIWNM